MKLRNSSLVQVILIFLLGGSSIGIKESAQLRSQRNMELVANTTSIIPIGGKMFLRINGDPAKDRGHNLTLICQSRSARRLDSVHCQSSEDCQKALTCLGKYSVEDCAKMTLSIKGHFSRGRPCSEVEKIGGSGKREKCFLIQLNGEDDGKRVSSYVECQSGSRGQRNVYYYSNDEESKLKVEKVDLEAKETIMRPKVPVRNYPGENKIYAIPP